MVLNSKCPLFFGGGVCFLQFFYFLAPYSIFGFLDTLRSLFWVWFSSFENLENGFGIQMPTFVGVYFLKFFYFLAPYSIFGVPSNFVESAPKNLHIDPLNHITIPYTYITVTTYNYYKNTKSPSLTSFALWTNK